MSTVGDISDRIASLRERIRKYQNYINELQDKKIILKDKLTSFRDKVYVKLTGYGHYVSESEYEKVQSEQELIDSYVHQESIIFDSPAGLVEESEYVPINTVNRLLQSDIQEQMEHIVPWLEENNIEVTQNELEALVIYRYNRGSLSSECKDLLMEGNRNESDWEDIWTGPPDRVEACQELFFDE